MKSNPLLLSCAQFSGNLTIDAAGNVYRLIQSYTSGAALVEHIGTLTDISDADYEQLASDDRARCTVKLWAD